MKTIPIAVILALAAAVPVFGESYSFKEPFASTHPLSTNGVLMLDNVNGQVDIRTWDRAEVRIEGEKSAQTDEELRLIELTIDPRPERVAIEVKLPPRSGGWFGFSNIRASVRFTITVPADTRLDQVRSTNGSVTIDGVRGSIRASSTNGSVKATGVANDVRLDTTNGSIELRAVTVPASGKIELHSTNGSVTLQLPKDTAARLDASTVNGHVECDFPVTVSGRISGSKLRGTIGTGGAEIKATTTNGNVRLRRQ